MNPSNDTISHENTAQQHSLLGLYRFIVGGLLVAILITGVNLVMQTQERHKTYQELMRLRRELVAMRVEESRLIIEQQTFSATPQIARRAVNELGMYYPANKEQATSGDDVETSHD